MPPKKAPAKADKKQQAQKQKVAEDKTFGLKNKNKSAKVQKYVQQVVHQAAQPSNKKAVDPEQARKEKKKAEEARKKELDDLFAQAIKQPKVPAGVDPKSVVCEFYRHGKCTKGFKCKFSHDLNVERKGAKIDIYSDRREDDEGNMEEWDQQTLESVVNQKHGAENKSNKTEIVCKFFIDAVEKRQYGWFWQCPNGKDCKYRHCLPPGYLLKSQMKELLEEEAKNQKAIEEIIEEERAKVDAKTPITEEVFRRWHAQKNADRAKKRAEELEDRLKKGVLSGREIFEQEGFVATDDVGASDAYDREVDEEREFKQAHEAALKAQREAFAQEGASESAAGPSSSSGSRAVAEGPSSSTNGLPLTQEEAEQIFGDDDDDEDMDDDDDDDDEDMDDDELEALAASLQNKTAIG